MVFIPKGLLLVCWVTPGTVGCLNKLVAPDNNGRATPAAAIGLFAIVLPIAEVLVIP